MLKKAGLENDDEGLPDKVKNLILRKLRDQLRDQKALLARSKKTAYSKLRKDVLEGIRSRKLIPSVPLAAYHDIVVAARAATEAWPTTVWETISSILSKANTKPRDGLVLNTIVDNFAWVIGHDPFTLDYINPENFTQVVRREIGQYGRGNFEDILSAFDRELDRTAKAAQCGINNAARQAREKAGIAIDEYLITQDQDSLVKTDKTETNPPAAPSTQAPKNNTGGTNAECLPNLPKNEDDWVLTIKDIVLAFYKKNERCPNEIEAWIQLRSSPPTTYGIKPGKHHGEQAVFMDERPLGKRAFSGRWKRYTTIK